MAKKKGKKEKHALNQLDFTFIKPSFIFTHTLRSGQK